MLLNLKKMMPEVIRERLETHDVETYSLAKAYAIKQVRNLKNTSKALPPRLQRRRRRGGRGGEAKEENEVPRRGP